MKHLLLAVLLLAPSALAQTPPAGRAKPACSEKDYHAFDFWVGEWSVVDPKGVAQGDNSITREEGGCLLVERWKAAGGGTGQSYNFYDDGLQQWRQLWVSQGSVIDYAGGLDAKGAMQLTGQIRYRDGHTAPFRGSWTLNADKTVTQHFEEWDPKTAKWTDWFTGIYKRKA